MPKSDTSGGHISEHISYTHYSAPNLDMEHWVFLPFLCV